MLDEITTIETCLEDVEDENKYVERFEELEVVLKGFIEEVRNWAPNPSTTDRLKRLNNIRDDLNIYKHAYANYAVRLISKKKLD